MFECKDCEGQRSARPRWGPGPWQEEPDYEAFTSSGLSCQVHRSFFSWWCGYVGLPHCHPLFEAEATEVGKLVKVQGNLWWAFWSAAHVISLPTRDDPGVWWVGFDFNLFGQAPADYGPLLQTGHINDRWRYWDVVDARREVKKLAAQLATLRGHKEEVPVRPRVKGQILFS
jgi:hypothetical protein